MSHNISNIDLQQGIRQAWHGLTQILEKITLANSWLAKWDVAKRPLYRNIDGNFVATDNCELFCTDRPEITVGKAVDCESYGLITNADFLAVCTEALASMPGAIVESVGSVCERSRIFVTVTIPEIPELKAAGRSFVPYLNFLSSHDKSAPFLVNASTVCTVCDNTFRMNLHDSENKEFRASVVHSKNAIKRLENIPNLIDAYCGTQRKFAAIMETLADKEVTQSQSREFFTGFLTVSDANAGRKLIASRPDRSALEISTRRANQIDRLGELFRFGKGNSGANRADLFSAVTDYYSHESSGGRDNVAKQIASSEFGSGQTFKARAFDLLQSDESVATLCQVGNLVLAAN